MREKVPCAVSLAVEVLLFSFFFPSHMIHELHDNVIYSWRSLIVRQARLNRQFLKTAAGAPGPIGGSRIPMRSATAAGPRAHGESDPLSIISTLDTVFQCAIHCSRLQSKSSLIRDRGRNESFSLFEQRTVSENKSPSNRFSWKTVQ